MKTKLILILAAIVVLLTTGCLSQEQKREIAMEIFAEKVAEELPEIWDEHCAERAACVVTYVKEKLDEISQAGANAMCLVCPFCSVMYDGNQKSIESQFDVSYDLPVLYLTQILGLAMGFDRKALGLNMNVVKTKHLLDLVFQEP